MSYLIDKSTSFFLEQRRRYLRNLKKMIRKNPSQMAMDTHIQKFPQMLTIH